MLDSRKPDTKKILLVEDDPGLLRLRGIALRAKGYEVLTAESPEKALKIFDGHRDVALVLTDQELGASLNGVQLLAALRDRGYDGPALLSSGNFDQQELARQVKEISDKHRVLKKGASLSQLHDLVDGMLGQQQGARR